MATIARIAEQARRRLAGGTPTDDFDPKPQELQIAARQALAVFAVKAFWEQKNAEGESWVPGEYIVSVDSVPVLLDTLKGQYYSEIPYQVMSLPVDMGIYQVSLQKGQKKPFTPIPNGSLGLMSELMVGQLAGNFGYYREQNKVYYTNVNSTNTFDTVLMKLVVAATDRDADEDFSIGPEIEAQIVQYLVQQFGYEADKPEDNDNDLNKD